MPKIKDGELSEMLSAVAKRVQPELQERVEDLERQLKDAKEREDELKRIVCDIRYERDTYRERVDEPLRNAWLGEAFEKFASSVRAYRPTRTFHSWPEKCPDCNDERMIEFTSPQGHTYRETCEKCGTRIVAYQPEEVVLKSFFPDDRNEDGTFGEKLTYEDAGGGTSSYVLADFHESIGEDEKFEDIFEKCLAIDYRDYKDVLFGSEEDCRRACEWVNERKGYPQKEEYRKW